MPDGTMKKERNFAKGGRRNWTRRYFILLSGPAGSVGDNVLLSAPSRGG
jgi:hypothetical protein